MVEIAILAPGLNVVTGFSIASGTVRKVIEINKYLLGTMAGGAGAQDLYDFFCGVF